MTDLNKLLTPIFLDEGEIRKLIELLFFSYRDFTSVPDKILESINFGRAHHRIIYFVGKKKGLTIKELLSILKITKQSLSRVLNQLVEKEYIKLTIGNDKRTKELSLTNKGMLLEEKLSKIQINQIKEVIKKSNEVDINGFKKILYEMTNLDSKKQFNILNNL